MTVIDVHIGSKIRLKVTEKGVKVTVFADQIGVSRENAYSIFKRRSIDTELLVRISRVLEHDFFQYYTPCANDGLQSAQSAELREQIAALKELLPLVKQIVKDKRKG